MIPHFAFLDVALLIGYFAGHFAVGFYFWRRSKSVDGFTAADRSLPGWLCGLSILGTYVSSISFIALPGKAFATNWNSFVFSLSLPLATAIAAKWFLPFYRQHGFVSAYTHLEKRFGSWARIYASACYLLTQLARIGAVTYLTALPMATLLHWDIRWIIVITGVTTTLYTFIGGIVAVIWTEAFHTAILIAGALSCAALMIYQLPGGWTQLARIAADNDKLSLGSLSASLGTPTVWVVLLYGLVINLQNFGVDQGYIQRYITAKSDREARKALWLGGMIYLPLSAVFFFIGTALFAYYKVHAGELPSDLHDPAKSDYVFPWFIVTALPMGLSGLLVASIFSAAMSAISSGLNSCATIILSDYYRRFVDPNATERKSMRVLYGATILWGLLGTLVALGMTKASSALDAWWSLAGIFGGGVLGLFLLGFVSRRATSRAGLAGVGVGVTIILWMSLSPRWTGALADWRSPFHSFLTIVFGTAMILVGGLVATALFTQRRLPTTPQEIKPNERII